MQPIEKHVEPEPLPASGDEKDDEDLDGVPLDGAALLKSALMRGIPGAAAASTESPLRDAGNSRMQNSKLNIDYDDEIDGIPRN